MFRISGDMDRYIQNDRLNVQLDRKARKLAPVSPSSKDRNPSQQNSNGNLYRGSVLVDIDFSHVLNEEIEKGSNDGPRKGR